MDENGAGQGGALGDPPAGGQPPASQETPPANPNPGGQGGQPGEPNFDALKKSYDELTKKYGQQSTEVGELRKEVGQLRDSGAIYVPQQQQQSQAKTWAEMSVKEREDIMYDDPNSGTRLQEDYMRSVATETVKNSFQERESQELKTQSIQHLNDQYQINSSTPEKWNAMNAMFEQLGITKLSPQAVDLCYRSAFPEEYAAKETARINQASTDARAKALSSTDLTGGENKGAGALTSFDAKRAEAEGAAYYEELSMTHDGRRILKGILGQKAS